MSAIAIIAAVVLFCLLIAGHEFGHYAAAKLLGVKVNEYSIGMGPLLWQTKKGETEYSLRALPIGGYCKIEGEDGDSDDDRSFGKKPWWAKVIILAAGAFMNFVLCILLLIGLFWYSGAYSTTLADVSEGYPAQIAGIQAGDTIVAIDGVEYDDWIEVVNAIEASKGSPMTFTVERGGQTHDYTLSAVESDGRYLMCITCKLIHSPIKAIGQAFSTTKSTMISMGQFFGQLFTGKASGDDVVGVVGIVSMIGEQAKFGFSNVVYLMAIISLNLGMVNLLPLPALDGGRILFVIIRLITRDKIGDNAEAVTHAVGMVLLLALMAFLIIKDLNRFVF
ncbi:MAG: RIP metalloprotease RseP [Firmicutes bacterium]|nr:RIP metalloprotease RseP [Bacillota bacterium]